MTSNDVRSLCDFLEQIEFEDAMLKSKNRQMDNAVNQIQIQERGIAVSKMKGQSEIKMLNSEIRILKVINTFSRFFFWLVMKNKSINNTLNNQSVFDALRMSWITKSNSRPVKWIIVDSTKKI